MASPSQEIPGQYDHSRQNQVRAVIIAMPIVSLFTVFMRFYTRLVVIKLFSTDDICAGIAFIFSIATSICMGYQVKYGMGRHVQTITPLDFINSQKSLYASILVYNPGLVFIKLSILLQYLRICIKPGVRLACKLIMGFVILYGIETFFTGLLTCIPIAYFWDKSIPGGKCVDTFALYYANAGFNIAQDFCVLALPVFMLWDVKIPVRQKIVLMFILALGGLACIASIFRLRTLHTISVSKDPTWDNTGTATWSALELNVGIICSCLTTLRPLANRAFPRAFPSISNAKSPYAHSSQPTKTQSRIRSARSRNESVRQPGGIADGGGRFAMLDSPHGGKFGTDEIHLSEEEFATGHGRNNSTDTEFEGEDGAFGSQPTLLRPENVMTRVRTRSGI